MKRVHIHLTPDQLAHADLVARNRGVPRAQMLRRLIAESLTRYPVNKEPALPARTQQPQA